MQKTIYGNKQCMHYGYKVAELDFEVIKQQELKELGLWYEYYYDDDKYLCCLVTNDDGVIIDHLDHDGRRIY